MKAFNKIISVGFLVFEGFQYVSDVISFFKGRR